MSLDRVMSKICTKRFVRLWSVLTALYIFGWATKWTFDPTVVGQFWPGRYFTAQADALLHGRLWVRQSDLPGECFFRSGHCYGYFGLGPSLLRLPLRIIAGPKIPEMTPLFIGIAAGLCTWGALDLCRRVVARQANDKTGAASAYLALAAIAVGPASAMILLTDPYVYQEAILWGAAGTIIGTNLLWRWWHERRQWQFVAATASYIFAACSRPTNAFVGTTFVLGVAWITRRQLLVNRKNIVQMVSLAALPAIAAFGIFFVKFGSPLPSFDTYEQRHNPTMTAIAELNDGKLSGIQFTPTILMATLRPDTIKWSSDWPWIRFKYGWPSEQLNRVTYLPPLKQDSIYVEKTVSLPDIMPLSVFATICILASYIRRRHWSVEFFLLVALCTTPLVASTWSGISSRYLGDWYPLVVIGTAFSAALLPLYVEFNRQSRNGLFAIVGVLSLATLVIAPTLATQYNWVYLYGLK